LVAILEGREERNNKYLSAFLLIIIKIISQFSEIFNNRLLNYPILVRFFIALKGIRGDKMEMNNSKMELSSFFKVSFGVLSSDGEGFPLPNF